MSVVRNVRNGHLQNHAISSRNQAWPSSNYFGQAFYGVFFLISKFKCHQLLLKHNLFLKVKLEKKINNPRKYRKKPCRLFLFTAEIPLRQRKL